MRKFFHPWVNISGYSQINKHLRYSAQEGLEATMTLRQYRHGENIIPQGVKTVNYGERYHAIETVDAVVSATLSPHYTVSMEEISTECSLR